MRRNSPHADWVSTALAVTGPLSSLLPIGDPEAIQMRAYTTYSGLMKRVASSPRAVPAATTNSISHL